MLRKFACSDIEWVRRLFQADDQFEEPRAVTNYVIVNVKLTNTPTNRQSTSFFSIYSKGPHRGLRAGSRATCRQIEISGIPNSHSAGERPQAARLLRSWVSFPPGAWIFVCCECRVLSGRGLCEELITRPEESYRLWCVVECDLETSRIGAPYIYDISSLRFNYLMHSGSCCLRYQQKPPLFGLYRISIPFVRCWQTTFISLHKINRLVFLNVRLRVLCEIVTEVLKNDQFEYRTILAMGETVSRWLLCLETRFSNMWYLYRKMGTRTIF